jgi:hypothetical protein
MSDQLDIYSNFMKQLSREGDPCELINFYSSYRHIHGSVPEIFYYCRIFSWTGYVTMLKFYLRCGLFESADMRKNLYNFFSNFIT